MSVKSNYYRFREELFREILRMQGNALPPVIKPKNNYLNAKR
jgi:hypothetical protein